MSNKVEIFCNDNLIESFNDFSLTKSIENFCNSFSFTITNKMANDIFLAEGSRIRISIADENQFAGLVESINHSQTSNSHSITVQGRDKTGELIDSYIIAKQYKQNDFLKLLRLVLNDNGYQSIKITSDIKILPKLVGKSFIPEKEEKIFSFIDRLAKQLRVILITDSDGDILITREGADLAVGGLDASNNIISTSLDIDTSESYKYIKIIGNIKTDQSKKRLTQGKEIIDERSQTNKRLIVNIGNNTNRQNIESIANWYMAVKRGKGARYNATVQGFLTNNTTGLLWQANTTVILKDSKKGINGLFLIQSVNYSQSLEGSKTDLILCNIGSFTDFDNNPFLSAQISKFFKITTGDLASKYRYTADKNPLLSVAGEFFKI